MKTRSASIHLAAPLLAILAALAVAFALVALAVPAAAQPDEPTEEADPTDVTVNRYAGTQRYDTARLIAVDTFDDADTVVIAKAEDWPDALAGNYLAGLFQAPILLVSRDAVQTDTLEALEELDASDVIVLGGTEAISAANDETLADAGYDVTRIFGTTRYETSAALAVWLHDDDDDDDDTVGEWDDERTAIVATGQQFADALVAGTVAFSENFPILLTPTASLHSNAQAALEELEIERVIIPGGTQAVSENTEAEIQDLDIDTYRVNVPGQGRWETAIAFADFAVDEFGYSLDHVNVATGFAFADALAMGPHAGSEGSPLLLTPGSQAAPTASLDAWLRENACEITSIDIAGGVGAVTQENEDAIVEAANDCDTDGATVTLADDSGTAGTLVGATFRGYRSDLRTIAVSGDCVDDVDILTISDGGDPGPMVEAPFVIADDAAEGECELTFTFTYADGSTETVTAVFTIIAEPDYRATITFPEEGFPVGTPITGTIVADDDDDVWESVAVSGECIDDVDVLEIETDGAFTLVPDVSAGAGECELTFVVTYDDDDDDVETQPVTVNITPPTGA